MMHSTASRITATIGLACGCLLIVAGCSSGSATPTPVAAPPSASVASPASAPPTRTSSTNDDGAATSTSAAVGAASARCDTLTPADVQIFMTDTAVGPTVRPTGSDSDGQDCAFSNADEDETVEIIVVPSSDPLIGYPAEAQDAAKGVPVAGVGEHAYRDADDYVPNAEANGITCAVTASVDQIPAGAAMITDGHSLTLTTAQSDAVATALGTLCNRIFGSGSTTPDLSALHN